MSGRTKAVPFSCLPEVEYQLDKKVFLQCGPDVLQLEADWARSYPRAIMFYLTVAVVRR